MNLRIHPREARVDAAKRELVTALNEAIERHSLTSGEQLRVVNELASEFVGYVARNTIRFERFGNTNEAGGLSAHKNGCGDPNCEGCR